MKGVILAGGLGSRLHPLTKITNKHLLPVYDKPMIFYPIQTLVDSGIDDVLLITSGPHVGHFLGILKNGKELGLKRLSYAYQEKPDGGIADALALAEDFAGGEDIAVILGDNIFDPRSLYPGHNEIKEGVERWNSHTTKEKELIGCMITVKEVSDPERFGVLYLNQQGLPSHIIEKPKPPAESNKAVTGLYLYESSVFDIIKTLKPSDRGELEITDVNNYYLSESRLVYQKFHGHWTDAGTFDTLANATEYWRKKCQTS